MVTTQLRNITDADLKGMFEAILRFYNGETKHVDNPLIAKLTNELVCNRGNSDSDGVVLLTLIEIGRRYMAGKEHLKPQKRLCVTTEAVVTYNCFLSYKDSNMVRDAYEKSNSPEDPITMSDVVDELYSDGIIDLYGDSTESDFWTKEIMKVEEMKDME